MPHSPLSDLEKNRPRFLEESVTAAQGLIVTFIFHNFDAFATTKHHRIDLNWYQSDISEIFATGSSAKGVPFLFLNFLMICANKLMW